MGGKKKLKKIIEINKIMKIKNKRKKKRTVGRKGSLF